MHTSIVALLVGAFALSGCSASPGPSEPSSTDDALTGARHVQANNCEIFIDRVGIAQGSHASMNIELNVKTLHTRLDGAIAEVGFRNASTKRGWTNTKLWPTPDANDYFRISLNVSADYVGLTAHWGAFYVKTDKDTYYWFKQASGEDFSFDRPLYDSLAAHFRSGTRAPTGTQLDAALREFNPNQCY